MSILIEKANNAAMTMVKVVASIWAFRRLIGACQHMILTDLHSIWGDRFRVPMGRRMATVFADPESIQQIFAQPPSILSAAKSRRRLIGVLPEKSVSYQDKDRHATIRKATAQAFNDRIKGFQPLSILASFQQDVSTVGSLKTPTEQYCYRLATEFMLGKEDSQFHSALIAVVEATQQFSPVVLAFSVLRRLPSVSKKFTLLEVCRDEFLSEIEMQMRIADESEDTSSYIASLLKVGGDLGLSREEIRDNIGMYAMAIGFNLRVVLTNAIHSLAKNRDWQERLRQANGCGVLSTQSPRKVSRAFVRECLRISPLVPLVSRSVERDVVINGYRLRAGEIVFTSPWLTHFRDAGFAHPDRFDPTRFMDGKQHGYNFIPFGGGAHHCVGSGWSIDMVADTITYLSQSFDFETENQTRKTSTEYAFVAFNMIRKSSGVTVSLRPEALPERKCSLSSAG